MKKLLSLILSIFIFSVSSLFSMELEKNNSLEKKVSISKIFEEKQKELIILANKPEYIKKILEILSLREKVIKDLFIESCIKQDNCNFTQNSLEINRKLKEITKKSYQEAENAYSEAPETVKTLIDRIEEYFITIVQQVQPNSQLQPNSQYHQSLTYNSIKPILNIKLLSADKHKTFLLSTKIFSYLIKVRNIAPTYTCTELYKCFINQLYTYFFSCYKKFTDKNLPNNFPTTIFEFDHINIFSKATHLIKICDFIIQIRLCKIVAKLNELIITKEKPYTYFSSNIKIRLQNKVLKKEWEPKLKPIKTILEQTLSKNEIIKQIKEAFTHASPLFIKELLYFTKLEEKFDQLSPFHFYFKQLKYSIDCKSGKYNKKLSDTSQINIKKIFDQACKNFQILNEILQPILITKTKETKTPQTIESIKQPNKPRKKIRRRRKRKKLIKQEKNKTDLKKTGPQALKAKETNQKIEPNQTEKVKEEPKQPKNETILPKPTIEQKKIKSTTEQKIFSILEQAPQIQIPVINPTNQKTVPLDLPTFVEGKDYIICNNIFFACILNLSRGKFGGYQNKIFILKNPDCKKCTINLLGSLKYRTKVKTDMVKYLDNNHSFPTLVEENFGQHCYMTETKEITIADKKEFDNQYKYKCYFYLPGRLTTLGYPITRFNELGEHAANGEFEFTILLKDLNDMQGLCVHRFFRPYPYKYY